MARRARDPTRVPARRDRPVEPRTAVAGRPLHREARGRPAGRGPLGDDPAGPSAVVGADVADLNHAAAVAWFSGADEPLLLRAFGHAELDLQETTEHRPRQADALLVAAAERLGIRRVAAFDPRPLAVFRSRHVRALDFEP